MLCSTVQLHDFTLQIQGIQLLRGYQWRVE